MTSLLSRMNSADADAIRALSRSVRAELLANILPYWQKNSRDSVAGGYWGLIRSDNTPVENEPRSVVMTSRHLWSYSAVSIELSDPAWLEEAHWAYVALTGRFIDTEYGGMYWSVTREGAPEVAKKQVYGEAFAAYALAEYARALLRFEDSAIENRRPDPTEPLRHALDLFCLLELHARDPVFGGYVEARDRYWAPTADLKLSDADMDCEKSMNTNLHVLEAFTALHRTLGAFADSGFKAVPGTVAGVASVAAIRERVGEALASLIEATLCRILGNDGHLGLYFTRDWKVMGEGVSYGHDIEASWLLWEAIEELGSAEGESADRARRLAKTRRGDIVAIARKALAEGVDPATGALENETHGGSRDRTRVWWCQAEALVGFFNAWLLSAERPFLDAALAAWQWIDRAQADRAGGDWFWSVDPEGHPDMSEPKGGNWKTPYHNARACMEIMRRARA